MMFRTFLWFLCAMNGVTVPTFASGPQNAKAFLEALDNGGSGSAGNGGGVLTSDFFRDGIVGLKSLHLMRVISDQENVRIVEAMKTARVFPVEFQLCVDDADSSCSNEQAYMSKNYPSRRIILVDARDLPGKWRQVSLKYKRGNAVHEFAGLAGVEVANHFFTAQIDDERIYSDYKTHDEVKKYFSLMNDYYYVLPGVSSEYFAGEWGKRTVLRPRRWVYSRSKDDLVQGAKFHLEMTLLQKDRVMLFDRSYSEGNGQGSDGSVSLCGSTGVIQKGEYHCYTPSRDRLAVQWKGRFKRLFRPSFPVDFAAYPVSEFDCKILSDDEMMCRNAYWKNAPLFVVDSIPIYEYSFYQRLQGEYRFFK